MTSNVKHYTKSDLETHNEEINPGEAASISGEEFSDQHETPKFYSDALKNIKTNHLGDQSENVKNEEIQQGIDSVKKKKNAGVNSNVKFSNSASIKNQLQNYPDSVVLDKVKSYVFDLQNEESLHELDDLYTKSVDPDNGVRILYEDKQFSQNTDNWKIFITAGYYKFKQLSV